MKPIILDFNENVKLCKPVTLDSINSNNYHKSNSH